MKDSEFVFIYLHLLYFIHLLYYKCHKINSNRDGSYTDSLV